MYEETTDPDGARPSGNNSYKLKEYNRKRIFVRRETSHRDVINYGIKRHTGEM